MATYLEFDSTYRNRVIDPLPASFQCSISQSGTNSRLNAVDPVSDAAIITIFTGSFGNDFAVNSQLSNINTTFTTPDTISLSSVPGVSFRTEDGFYNGAPVIFNTYNHTHHIARYTYMSPIVGRLILDTTTPYTANIPTGCRIWNPSSYSGDSPTIFIPNSPAIDNYYAGYIIQNLSLSETRTITSFSSLSHVATLSSATAGWTNFHVYAIRKELPINSGTVGASTTTTVTLAASASSIDDDYKGSFLRIRTIPALIVPPYSTTITSLFNEVRQIIAYDGTTKVATVASPFSSAPSAANNEYDVEQVNRDNYTPVNYSGTLTSGCMYDVSLISLSVPNKVLVSGGGDRVSFHPYIYVELKQISPSTGNSAVNICSNNPNAVGKLFRVAIDDTPTPILSAFIKLDGDGSTQRIQFNLSDSYRLSVYHPDNSLYETQDSEFYSPSKPNPLIQISAVFSVKRVDE